MIKKVVGSWAFWGLYGYVIGPAIDKAIPESDNDYILAAKSVNQLFTMANKLCFMTPILTVQAVVENIKTKVAE